MEGDRSNRFSDSSDKNEFDDETYNQLNSENKDNSSKKSKKEKANVVAVIVVAIVAIFLGVYAVVDGISNPFFFLDSYKSETVTTSTQGVSSDTDKDGLADYDEVNVYGSSPYLEDTDGDGIKDNDEIKAKSDPNCPQGQTCSGGYKFSSSSDASVPSFGMPDSPSVKIDPATIRQLLIQSGMNSDDVNQLTDAQILELYEESMKTYSSSTDVSVPVSSSTTVYSVPATIDVTDLKITSMDDLKNLSGAQIKALMIKNGASADLISEMSDEEIKNILVEKLSESN